MQYQQEPLHREEKLTTNNKQKIYAQLYRVNKGLRYRKALSKQTKEKES